MKSRELSLLPKVRPIAMYYSSTMDFTGSGNPVFIPDAQWATLPSVDIKTGKLYSLSVHANFISADLNMFNLYVKVGASNYGVIDNGNIRPGRATAPFTVDRCQRFDIVGDGIEGLQVIRLGFVAGTAKRILALTGSPVFMTVWESDWAADLA